MAGLAIARSPARLSTRRWRRIGSRTSGGLEAGSLRASGLHLPHNALMRFLHSTLGVSLNQTVFANGLEFGT
jgi:hypothetical protein